MDDIIVALYRHWNALHGSETLYSLLYKVDILWALSFET
jgi:hypothetical protein